MYNICFNVFSCVVQIAPIPLELHEEHFVCCFCSICKCTSLLRSNGWFICGDTAFWSYLTKLWSRHLFSLVMLIVSIINELTLIAIRSILFCILEFIDLISDVLCGKSGYFLKLQGTPDEKYYRSASKQCSECEEEFIEEWDEPASKTVLSASAVMLYSQRFCSSCSYSASGSHTLTRFLTYLMLHFFTVRQFQPSSFVILWIHDACVYNCMMQGCK